MTKDIRKLLALGASLSLVALTACGDGGGEEPEASVEPAEAEGNVEDVPALSDIDDVMWDAMEESGSVTLVADFEAFADEDPQSAEMFEQMSEGDLSDVRLFGALDGSGSAMSLGEEELLRSFEDATYISSDAIFNILASQTQSLGAEDQQAFDELAEEFAGSWIDFSDEMQPGDGSEYLNVGYLFDDLRNSWEDGDGSAETPIEREEISDEGTHEVRDDMDVWIYTGEEDGQELVIEANHDSPKIVGIADGEVSMAFTDWGDTETPEQPDESELMTEEDIQQRMGGGTGSGTGDTGDVELEPSAPETAPETDAETDTGSGLTTVPGVGTVDCDGPVPGDPGFSDPNDNYTDEEIQAFQDACN